LCVGENMFPVHKADHLYVIVVLSIKCLICYTGSDGDQFFITVSGQVQCTVPTSETAHCQLRDVCFYGLTCRDLSCITNKRHGTQHAASHWEKHIVGATITQLIHTYATIILKYNEQNIVQILSQYLCLCRWKL